MALTLLLLASAEVFWRAMGHVPSVNDDAALWMVARSAVRPNDARQVVLIGASRMQQDIDLELLADDLGGRKPIQLAVGGTTFLPVLADLAGDESFRGVVICDVVPFLFYPGGFSTREGPSAEYVESYKRQSGTGGASFLPRLERQLRTVVQETFVLRMPALAPTASNLQHWFETRKLPGPDNRVMRPDRSQKADYKRLDQATLERTKQLWVSRIQRFGYGPQPEALREGLASLESMVRRIQERGGRVVFVAFPVSGVVRQGEEEHQPRHEYWDVLVSQTSAITIHVDDYPQLASFECPEGSHLDYRDAERFTEAFAKILKTRLDSRVSWNLSNDAQTD